MKKVALLLVIMISLAVFGPGQASAADAGLIVYMPRGTSLTTERIIYNAVTSVGELCRISERRSGRDSFDALMRFENSVVAGVSELTQREYSDGIEKVDIPVGKVEFTAYMREAEKLPLDSWDDFEGLGIGLAVDSNYVASHFEEYTSSPDVMTGFENLLNGAVDVFISTEYDGIAPQLPEGVARAGMIDSAVTYCWYNRSRPDIGELLKNGLEAIEANGTLDRIMNHQSVDPTNPKVVFHLSSYPTEMIWEAQAEESLHEALLEYEDPVSLYIHNMNFRRTNFRAAQYDAATEFIRASFMGEYPDVIIAMDNDALGYLQENYKRLFEGVPVVFCGINGYNESLTSEFAQYATGLSEYIDPTETVEFALSSNPGIKRIHTVFDETSSASPVKASLMEAIEERYGDRLEITSSGNQTFAEVVAEAQGFDENTMLLIGTYFSDKNGRFMSEREVAEGLCGAVDIPVYSLMSGYLGHGVVGGRVAYSRSFITEAAHIALRILKGESVSEIPIVGEIESEARFNTFIVDKKAADRFDISDKLFRGRAVIVNDDENVFEEYPVQSTVAIALILISIVTSALCIMLMRAKRLRDIALITADKEKENSRMKSDFLARMSHEIRTPLNAIIGMDELILRDHTRDNVHQNALVILHSGRSLLSIINDILDFSKIESGKMELVVADYDVGSLLYDTISMIRVRVSEKPIEVKMDISKEFPAFLYGDETRVRQILLNFLTNSAKYTNEGFITLKGEFEFDNEEKNGGMAVFTVSDTGIGIKREDIAKLFGAFSQVDAKTNRKVEGTGLGLAITKTLVEMMNGDIAVESEYGKGSTFTVRIRQEVHSYRPLTNASEAFSRHLEYEGTEKEVRFVAPGARILAVDDVEANLLVISGLLSPYKVRIDTVSNGFDAIDAVEKNEYDFVFMDHMMPGMDGVETTQKIRELRKERVRQVPIIALTANAIAGMKEMFLENGFNDFISKPIEIEELNKIMYKWIPKEKHLPLTEDRKEAEAAGGLNGIEGINISQGLHRFSGKTEVYERILRNFTNSLLKGIEGLSELLSQGNYEELSTALHSIKGMSANVDCTEVYELSVSLETAAKESDYEYVGEKLPVLIEKAEAVVKSIRRNLPDDPED